MDFGVQDNDEDGEYRMSPPQLLIWNHPPFKVLSFASQSN